MRRRKDHRHLHETMETENGEGEFVPRDFADWREIPSTELERKELRQVLSAALESLAPLYREVFTLRDVEQLSVSEAAAALGISQAAVKTRLHRARLQLREMLAPVFQNHRTSRPGDRPGVPASRSNPLNWGAA